MSRASFVLFVAITLTNETINIKTIISIHWPTSLYNNEVWIGVGLWKKKIRTITTTALLLLLLFSFYSIELNSKEIHGIKSEWEREKEKKIIRAPIAVGPFRKPTKQHVFAHNSNTVYCKKVWLAIARRIIGTRAHHHTQLDCCRITRLAEISTHTYTHTCIAYIVTHTRTSRSLSILNPLFNMNFANRLNVIYIVHHQIQFNSIINKKILNKIWLFSLKTRFVFFFSIYFSNQIFIETKRMVICSLKNIGIVSKRNGPQHFHVKLSTHKKTVRKIV